MKQRALLSTILGLTLLLPAAALGKGASEATSTGPGIGDGITLAGEGQVGGGQLSQLAQEAGFFPSVFATSPNPMLAKRPGGDHGPRYRIVYTMPGPNGVTDLIRQDLYPYATPQPVTYVEPGQQYFGTERTVGGWYVASSTLKEGLVAVGLPETAPGDGGGTVLPWAPIGAAAIVAVLASLGLVLTRARRRSEAAPA